MGIYSIKELERLSGIKAHTIRIWEKRYKIIRPQRTPTNIRFYSDDDLKKIINIAVLNSRGLKISKITGLSNAEITKRVSELDSDAADTQVYVDRLIVAMIDLEERQFEKTLASVTLKLGFDRAITDIVYPFLEKIGILWQTGGINPAQEHFISQLVRQKLIVAIDALPYAPDHAPSAVLLLPENELHELGLLFCNYLFRKAGLRTFYLGQTVPYADAHFVCKTYRPDCIVLSMTTRLPASRIEHYLAAFVSDFPDCQILLTGRAIERLELDLLPKVSRFRDLAELQEILKEL